MFYQLGLRIVARARLVLTVALVALGICAVLGVSVFGSLLSGGFDNPASASSKAKVLLDQRFGGEPDFILLVHARTGTVDDPAVVSAGQALTTRMGADSRLSGVTSYWTTRSAGLRSLDGSDALVLGRVVGDDKKAASNATALLSAYAHLDDSAVTVQIGGAQGTDVGGQVGKDLALAEGIAVPITLLLLVVAFGSLVAALLPLAVTVFAIFASLATLDVLTHVTNVSVFAINLTTALGLGLGIDYALLMVSRFREELTRTDDVEQAVATTVATAGRTIAFSSLTVAVALAAMLVFPVYFLKSFAYAGISVTIFAALSALIVLPALLAVVGRRVNAGRVKGIRADRGPEAPFWGHVAGSVMKHPLITAIPAVVVMLVLAAPLLNVTFGTPDDRVLPTSAASHQVGTALRQQFATKPDPIDVLIEPAISRAALAQYAQQLSALPAIQRADSTAGSFASSAPTTPGAEPSSLTSGNVQRIELSTGLDPASGAAQSLLRKVRAIATPSGTTTLVGGATAILLDGKQAISSRLPLAAAIIILTTFILLFLFTGSIVHPIRALLGNALTLSATLGVMVWIFQEGHLAAVLGFTPTATNTSMPVLLFCVAFGLSMDYEVFLMSRVKELHDSGADNEYSVRHGLARTGRIVSTAAALLAVSFFAFGTSSVSFIQFFGLGTGLAILLDATIVRGILVPAFMRALGENSWYAPPALRRLHQRIGLGEASDSTPVSEPVA